MTKDMTQIKALAYAIENGNFPEDVVDRLESVKASLEKKKANKKPKKATEEQVAIREALFKALTEAPADKRVMKVGEIVKAAGLNINTQKATPQVKILVAEGKIIKVDEGKKSEGYCVPTEDAAEV